MQLHLAEAEKDSSVILLKAEGAGEPTARGWKIACSICYLSDEQRSLILRQGNHRPTEALARHESSFPPVKERIGFMREFFRRRAIGVVLTRAVVGLAFVIMTLLFVSYYYQRSKRQKSESGSTSYFDAFQKSVQQAFGFGNNEVRDSGMH